MEELFKQYKDYYLIKCFGKEQYRSDFNKGNLYLNSVSYFHNAETEFQKDKEGIVFIQPKDMNLTAIAATDETSDEATELLKKGEFEKAFQLLRNDGKPFAKTNNLKLYINGYLSCFFLLPKKYITFVDNSVDINPLICQDFFKCLNNYAENQGYLFFSIYDAENLIKTFYESITEKGYKVAFGTVSYTDITDETRIQWYTDKKFDNIVFSKPKDFDYQREFRFFITPNAESNDEVLKIQISSLEDTVVHSLCYLTPQYAQKVKVIKNEIQL